MRLTTSTWITAGAMTVIGTTLLGVLWLLVTTNQARWSEGAELLALGRYLLGILVELSLVLAIAQASYHWIFKATQYPGVPAWGSWVYGAWLALLFWLFWIILQWRTAFEFEFADENALLAGVAVLAVVGFAFGADYFRSRRQHLQLLQAKSTAELQALKAQLNPHFLFNTLNAIFNSALKNDDPATAAMIEELAALLRFSIVEAQKAYTSIDAELTFLDRYLRLQQARLPQRPNLQLEIALDWDEQPAWIAPLLLVPLIENAFLYGISMDHPSFCRLQLTVQHQRLLLDLRNSIAPGRESKKGLGTGLPSVRQRLELLYPRRHQLTVTDDGATFQVLLTLDLDAQLPNSVNHGGDHSIPAHA